MGRVRQVLGVRTGLQGLPQVELDEALDRTHWLGPGAQGQESRQERLGGRLLVPYELQLGLVLMQRSGAPVRVLGLAVLEARR